MEEAGVEEEEKEDWGLGKGCGSCVLDLRDPCSGCRMSGGEVLLLVRRLPLLMHPWL